MWTGRHVILGVTGGIAAYKSVLLARELTRSGAIVDVVLSHGATEFIGAVTFEALTHRRVVTSLWAPGQALDHITSVRDADLIIVAPATASLLARAAAGLADDFLGAALLAAKIPIVLAPAMNDGMYSNQATQDNLYRLKQRGWHQAGPVVGDLAEGASELPGRMAEPAAIMAVAERALSGHGRLTGKHVVITAGPTREAIDPVRFISNRSSGKMGYRLAEAAWRRGAVVTLISGPGHEPRPWGVELIRVDTTAEMAEAVYQVAPQTDVLIMAAAPADFRPAIIRDSKLPRAQGGFTLSLESTEDILLGMLPYRHADMTVVGFALETDAIEEKALAKLHRKQLDLVVANDALRADAAFEVDTNAVVILDAHGNRREVPLDSKAKVADALLDAIQDYRGA